MNRSCHVPSIGGTGFILSTLRAAQRRSVTDANVVAIIIRISELFLEDAFPAGVLLAVAALAAMAAPGGAPGLRRLALWNGIHPGRCGNRSLSRFWSSVALWRGPGHGLPREQLARGTRAPPASGRRTQGAEGVKHFAEGRQLQPG